MGKTLNGKHAGKSGKQSLHHTGKWVVRPVRFPRELARVDRAFDATISFLVRPEIAPYLAAIDLGGHPISGSRLTQIIYANYLRDGLQGLRLVQADTLRSLGASDQRIKLEMEDIDGLARAMHALTKAIIRRVQRVRTETSH